MKRFIPLAAILLIAGCFETSLSLGPRDAAKADPKYVGDWHYTWTDGGQTKTADLFVRNFDGHQYYVEWIDSDAVKEGKGAMRFNGYSVDVKGTPFAQLTILTDDGSLEEKHLLVRFELKDSKLMIRHLNEHFFDGVTTDADLQKKVAENLDKADMYEGEALAGTKMPPKEH